MKIINSEISIPKIQTPNAEYFENFLNSQNIDYLRWAIVGYDDENFVLNVSHKAE